MTMLPFYISKSCSMRYCVSISKRSCHQSPHVNELTNTKHNTKLEQQQSNNLTGFGRFVKSPVLVNKQLSKGDSRVKRELDAAKDSLKILGIIEKYHSEIQNPSMYGKAMQKCNVLRDWNSVHKIMQLMQCNPHHEPTLTEFNVFLNSMARSNLWNALQIATECYKSMIHKYKLTPDVITFGILLKLLTKKLKYHEAEQCWHTMTHTYYISPNELLYNQMITIYSKTHQHHKATQLFNEYLDKVQCKKLPLHIPTINAYLNTWAETGDTEQVQIVLDMIDGTKGVHLDEIGIITVMKCCIVSGKYNTCIEILQNWLDEDDRGNNGRRCTHPMLHLKCHSLTRLIAFDEYSFEERYEYYLQLQNTIYHESVLHNIDITDILAKTHLEGAIYLYADHDPMEIVNVFETLLAKEWIGYLAKGSAQQIVIDLHGFEFVETQFVLRYLFAFKAKEWMDHEKIEIVVGKGKHSEGIKHEKGLLRESVMKELTSWEPSIHAHVSPSNSGVLFVDREQILSFLDHDCNFAVQTLRFPSRHWVHLVLEHVST
eukprot:101786_1